jgi:hypothetical protein
MGYNGLRKLDRDASRSYAIHRGGVDPEPVRGESESTPQEQLQFADEIASAVCA